MRLLGGHTRRTVTPWGVNLPGMGGQHLPEYTPNGYFTTFAAIGRNIRLKKKILENGRIDFGSDGHPSARPGIYRGSPGY